MRVEEFDVERFEVLSGESGDEKRRLLFEVFFLFPSCRGR